MVDLSPLKDLLRSADELLMTAIAEESKPAGERIAVSGLLSVRDSLRSTVKAVGGVETTYQREAARRKAEAEQGK
jgi:hypothetical protein